MITRIVSLIIGYLLGSLSLAYFLGLLIHKDIRKFGSGNLGSTNAVRVLGIKKGLFVFAFDIVKAVCACGISLLVFKDSVAAFYGALGAVLGHCFPFYIQFKGGKGVATYLGAVMFFDFRIAIISLIIFLIVFMLKKYVSLGSIIASFSVIISWLVFHLLGILACDGSLFIESFVIVFLISVLVVVRHSSNIIRLINGTENKFKKPEAN